MQRSGTTSIHNNAIYSNGYIQEPPFVLVLGPGMLQIAAEGLHGLP